VIFSDTLRSAQRDLQSTQDERDTLLDRVREMKHAQEQMNEENKKTYDIYIVILLIKLFIYCRLTSAKKSYDDDVHKLKHIISEYENELKATHANQEVCVCVCVCINFILRQSYPNYAPHMNVAHVYYVTTYIHYSVNWTRSWHIRMNLNVLHNK
jgi:hypothetical protein